MKLKIINKDLENSTKEKLEKYYENNFIPAEKKNYLTDLSRCVGPYLACSSTTGESHWLLDAASQIATLGLGFNHSAFMGTAHYLSSWTNDKESAEFKSIRLGFESFLARSLKRKSVSTTFCNSGAEANEIALGHCFKNRPSNKANKILAFEGSFHGRLLMSLQSTWNPSKREPFEWPGFDTIFCPSPALADEKINLPLPNNWCDFWDSSASTNIEVPADWKLDPIMEGEVKSLLKVRTELLTGAIFSIIVEPMQCEGGDRYLSNRFFTALLLMAKAFRVGTIFDEVQTGFHLGEDFFWHMQFDLRGPDNNPLIPEHIVCAKKAQIGLVISDVPNNEDTEEFQVASVIRGYHHAVTLDQNKAKILKLAELNRNFLSKFCSQFSNFVESPRGLGLCFAFDLKNKEHTGKFIANRFDYGLLFYPAGDNTLRFRLNLAFGEKDLEFLYASLTAIAEFVFNSNRVAPPTHIETNERHTEELYIWQHNLLMAKLNCVKDEKATLESTVAELEHHFKEAHGFSFEVITEGNFQNIEKEIVQLQKNVYEPVRQTPIEKFKTATQHPNSICLALRKNNELAAICFAGPLKLFPYEKGTRRDPGFENQSTLYMLDCTVAPPFLGRGLGKYLKYALTQIAVLKNIDEIHGRNRDQMASSMHLINTSLGATELFYNPEDYLDDEKYRDVWYYSSPVSWSQETNNLSSGLYAPIGIASLNNEFLKSQLPAINNKLCLSNFVSERYLDNLKEIFELLPKELKHGYTASGQSECIDKLAKLLWNKNKKHCKSLTFKSHYFGAGSFLSRSLNEELESFFPVDTLAAPTTENVSNLLKEVETLLKTNSYLGVWIEPIPQQTMERVPLEFLKGLKAICEEYSTPLVFNETASSQFRYTKDSYFLAQLEEVRPDCGFVALGGQAAIIYTNETYFIEKPLMLISTWDGDEFALSNYHCGMKNILKDKKYFHSICDNFSKKLKEELLQYANIEIQIERGFGWVTGPIPSKYQKLLSYKNDRYLICPSFDHMKFFLENK
ncbi:MAG: aminotransferase class III-fold pyridoxal phosphate-dependent enzyme [Halobacteriovoraceae bacterium]|nr:aminotransferase class III-fold pyridoxal phosphate-dependent enzyme [Halobacteriovoraceae bacterium]